MKNKSHCCSEVCSMSGNWENSHYTCILERTIWKSIKFLNCKQKPFGWFGWRECKVRNSIGDQNSDLWAEKEKNKVTSMNSWKIHFRQAWANAVACAPLKAYLWGPWGLLRWNENLEEFMADIKLISKTFAVTLLTIILRATEEANRHHSYCSILHPSRFPRFLLSASPSSKRCTTPPARWPHSSRAPSLLAAAESSPSALVCCCLGFELCFVLVRWLDAVDGSDR